MSLWLAADAFLSVVRLVVVTGRMVAAMSILFAASFAAGVDPLGIAVVTAACLVVLLVRSRPTLIAVLSGAGPLRSSPVRVRPGREAEGGADGSDCPVILTVIRR
jgi:hypothetical protein